jgi:phenylpyruvate tautomerase PptA (4-oxalocrotonate tautomerase family)
MPRWNIYTLEGTISRQDKDKLAEQITALYVDLGIPAFLVNVFFHEMPISRFYSGGKAEHNSVCLYIDHAARNFDTEPKDMRLNFIKKVNEIASPIHGKGTKWEYNIYDHPRDNWRINGMIPPMDYPEVLKEWIAKNDPFQYDGSG